MITKQDLLQAIAECQGTRNPNANTAIKLAAFYTILDHLDENETVQFSKPNSEYSFSAPPNVINVPPNIIDYNADTEFAKAINGKPQSEVLSVIDELMQTIRAMNERLYNAVMNKLQ